MQDITPFLPGDTVAFLRLADDDRRFPFRPIAPGLFLIGHGPCCDLRLGVPEMPPLHSAIQIDTSSAKISRVAESPELYVNGESVTEASLVDGDIIEIGDIRLVFFLCNAAAEEVVGSESNIASLNALQLVDGLEAELRLLTTETSSNERIHELLRAAQQAVDACQFSQTIRFADYANAPQNEKAEDVSSGHELILSRLSAQETRLDEICHVLEQVVQQQQMIATALQCVVERLDEIRENPQSGAMRASA